MTNFMPGRTETISWDELNRRRTELADAVHEQGPSVDVSAGVATATAAAAALALGRIRAYRRP